MTNQKNHKESQEQNNHQSHNNTNNTEIHKVIETFNKSLEQITAFTRENVEAVFKSSSTANKHAENIFSEIFAFSKQNIEDTVNAAKEIAATKSPEALAKTHTNYTQKAFENYLTQSRRINELFVNASKDVSAPLADRLVSFKEIIVNANKKFA